MRGQRVRLRQIREADLDRFYEFHQDVANRGPYFPIGVHPETVFRRKYAETGFWGETDGILLVTDIETDEMVGHVEFFRTVAYLDELELSYHIYDAAHTGRGFATEAVALMTRHLFDRTKHNRIRLIIHPDNVASKRVAAKCGYRHEGTARGAWYHRGTYHDVEMYALLRDELGPPAPAA